ncbi:hypothetical protein [Flavihumibacter sp.]|uniref:hypothetical protein n=1 Tax=Flavihumibacter sp. TaxID=1913981 RepID=UPI002FC999A9
MCRHQQQFGGDGILLGISSFHHHFYLYSAAVRGWKFNEYPAFGNTCSVVRKQGYTIDNSNMSHN